MSKYIFISKLLWGENSINNSEEIDIEKLEEIYMKNILMFYKFSLKYLNIDFYKYSEFFFIKNNFKIEDECIFSTLFLLFFVNNRLSFIDEKYLFIFSNNNLIYIFSLNNFFNTNLNLIKFNKTVKYLKNTITSSFFIKYSPTTAIKYINSNYNDLLKILFLRKNKIFNKGRYSRNRQFYRTGVYWCLYINIIAIVGLYFWFYRFVMNFGYLWWLLFASLGIFILSKVLNYNLITVNKIVKSIKSDFIIFIILLNNLLLWVKNSIMYFNNTLYNVNFLSSLYVTNKYLKNDWWVINGLINYFLQHIQWFIYLWGYNSVNYYIHSITMKFSRFSLDSKKYKFFIEFSTMISK